MATENKYLDIPLEIKLDDINEDGTFSGHASLFDQEPDSHMDLVARGAFAESLAQGGRNKSGIPMLFGHRSDKIPGVWIEIREDTKGLWVKGQLALETQLGKDTYEIMLLGAKTGTFRFGLSIGFDALDFDFHTPKGETRKIRTLKKVSLWEISLVTFPAKIGAAVSNIKEIDVTRIKEAKTERELEKVLREVDGLSECSAKLLVKMCKPFMREAFKEEDDTFDMGALSELLDSLTTTNKNIQTNIQTAEILGSLKEINL